MSDCLALNVDALIAQRDYYRAVAENMHGAIRPFHTLYVLAEAKRKAALACDDERDKAPWWAK